jgi:hypothetical protein
MVPSAYDITREPLHSSSDQETERDPLTRRFWLLRQALKSGSSMAEALKIAEEVEAFLVAGAASCSSNNTPNKFAAAPLETAHGKPRAMLQAVPSSLLNPEEKAELSARLDACNSNAQLAVEFGLTPRQVQGFRMQVGRRAKSKIAAINPQPRAAASAPASLTNSPVIDEVVRYLRQQGDVVVADGPGMFLLNGRFRLDVDQLQHRANRMRQRQRKPEFQIGERPMAGREGGSARRLPAPIGR